MQPAWALKKPLVMRLLKVVGARGLEPPTPCVSCSFNFIDNQWFMQKKWKINGIFELFSRV